jgi:hypothetical protein
MSRLLGLGDPGPDAMVRVFRDILATDAEDGVRFDSDFRYNPTGY